MTNELLLAHAVSEPEWLDEPRVLRDAFPARNIGCDPRVDYAAMQAGIDAARNAFPNAHRIVALWVPNSRVGGPVALEIWHDEKHAQVVNADALR